MMGPSIMSLVLAWEPQLKALFKVRGVEGVGEGEAGGREGRADTSAQRGSLHFHGHCLRLRIVILQP